MMQEFHPDCTINLLLKTVGKAEKFLWGCSLYYRGKRIVLAVGFIGAREREYAQLHSLCFALRQAHRLKQEKVLLQFDYGDLFTLKKTKKKDLQPLLDEAQSLWEDFRLKRINRLEETDRNILHQEVDDFFKRN